MRAHEAGARNRAGVIILMHHAKNMAELMNECTHAGGKLPFTVGTRGSEIRQHNLVAPGGVIGHVCDMAVKISFAKESGSFW